jgi:hypothetical protein
MGDPAPNEDVVGTSPSIADTMASRTRAEASPSELGERSRGVEVAAPRVRPSKWPWPSATTRSQVIEEPSGDGVGSQAIRGSRRARDAAVLGA